MACTFFRCGFRGPCIEQVVAAVQMAFELTEKQHYLTRLTPTDGQLSVISFDELFLNAPGVIPHFRLNAVVK